MRVLQAGKVEAPSDLELIDRPHPSWTVEACNEVMYHLKRDRARAAELAGLAELSDAWRTTLLARASSG